MSQCTDLDIDRVVPHVDLVLFDNVLSCYTWNKDITVNYTLGNAVRSTTWDWVGIFPTDWHYLGEYVAYSWVPKGTDVTNPRRRGLVIPAKSHKIPPNDDDRYTFLYIASGNHVVGVSATFRVTDEEVLERLYIERLFFAPRKDRSKGRKGRALPDQGSSSSSTQSSSSSSDSGPSFQQLCCSGFYDYYEIVNETITPESGAVPKRQASSKRKITNIYRDAATLVNIGQACPEKLRIIDVHPVVQEYMDNRLRSVAVTTTPKIVPLYDVDWKIKEAQQDGLEIVPQRQRFNFLPAIEYPDILSITAGPESYMIGVNSTSGNCTNCLIGKTLVQDLADKFAHKSRRLAELEDEVKAYKINAVEKTCEKSNSETSKIDRESTVDLLDWCLEQMQDDNQSLRSRIRHLEELLMNERAKHIKPDVTSRESLAAVMTQDNSTSIRSQTHSADASLATPYVNDADGWCRKEPRRIERLRRASVRQARNVHLLRETINVKDTQIGKLREDNAKLRRMLKNEKDQTHIFCTLADELNLRIRAVLAERAKDRTNEWRRFVREVERSPCPTPCPSNASESDTQDKPPVEKTNAKPVSKQHIKNKHVAKVLGSEKRGKTKLHKEKAEAEECPTCGLKFSLKADRRVVQKHMDFHSR